MLLAGAGSDRIPMGIVQVLLVDPGPPASRIDPAPPPSPVRARTPDPPGVPPRETAAAERDVPAPAGAGTASQTRRDAVPPAGREALLLPAAEPGGIPEGSSMGGAAAGGDQRKTRVRLPPAQDGRPAGAAFPSSAAAEGGGGGSGGEGTVRLLRDRIESRITYPEEAVRRGQEGVVLLRIRVGEGGIPKEVRVARSSGARILDEAARSGVVRASPLPSVPGWFEVPVRFLLR